MISFACTILIMINKEYFYMQEAIEEAKKALVEDEVPIGCIIVCDDKIIASAHNKKEQKNRAIYHAEIEAIILAEKVKNNWNLSDCDMYVTLEPCMMCAGAILNARIRRVYYGTKSFKAGFLHTKIALENIMGLNHYPQIIPNILQEKCAELLHEYFLSKRKKQVK